jgi:hypothetical protein
MKIIERDEVVDAVRVGPLSFQGFTQPYGKFSLHPTDQRTLHYQRHIRLGPWSLDIMRTLNHTDRMFPKPELRLSLRGKRHEVKLSLFRPVDNRFCRVR